LHLDAKINFFLKTLPLSVYVLINFRINRNFRVFKLGFLLLLLFTCIVLYIRFGQILTASPNHVIQGYGDAFNAYNIVTYHAKYDATYTVFEGMGYPYGEHVTIASTIPLISNGLKFLV